MSYDNAELRSIDQITPSVKQFQLKLENTNWEFKPGQHTVIRFKDENGEEVERPYTPITMPETEKFCLAIKKYDNGTASVWMHNRELGDEVEVEKPHGNLHIEDYDNDIVLVSTGTGATPMYAMLRDYLKNGTGKVFYFHGEKTQEHLIFQESLDVLESEHDNLEVIYSLSDEDWSKRTGFIQEHIPKVLDRLGNKDFYICGVPQMVVDTEDLLQNEGVNEENIITEGWESDATE